PTLTSQVAPMCRSGPASTVRQLMNSELTTRSPNSETVRVKVVSARDAARLVGLSASTLAKLRLNGNGPLFCKLGRRVLYRTADLEQWLQSRLVSDTTDANARFLKALTIAHRR